MSAGKHFADNVLELSSKHPTSSTSTKLQEFRFLTLRLSLIQEISRAYDVYEGARKDGYGHS